MAQDTLVQEVCECLVPVRSLSAPGLHAGEPVRWSGCTRPCSVTNTPTSQASRELRGKGEGRPLPAGHLWAAPLLLPGLT